MRANDIQVGGEHYKMDIEPWDAIHSWGLGYFDGTAVKYLARWKKKNGVQDLQKAKHFIEKLIEVETAVFYDKDSLNQDAEEAEYQASEAYHQGYRDGEYTLYEELIQHFKDLHVKAGMSHNYWHSVAVLLQDKQQGL